MGDIFRLAGIFHLMQGLNKRFYKHTVLDQTGPRVKLRSQSVLHLFYRRGRRHYNLHLGRRVVTPRAHVDRVIKSTWVFTPIVYNADVNFAGRDSDLALLQMNEFDMLHQIRDNYLGGRGFHLMTPPVNVVITPRQAQGASERPHSKKFYSLTCESEAHYTMPLRNEDSQAKVLQGPFRGSLSYEHDPLLVLGDVQEGGVQISLPFVF